jgi:hypothetical protein
MDFGTAIYFMIVTMSTVGCVYICIYIYICVYVCVYVCVCACLVKCSVSDACKTNMYIHA